MVSVSEIESMVPEQQAADERAAAEPPVPADPVQVIRARLQPRMIEFDLPPGPSPGPQRQR